MANSNVTIRIDDDLKVKADELFGELGMSFTTAINIFIKQAIREERIPFEITLNPKTGSGSSNAERYEYAVEDI